MARAEWLLCLLAISSFAVQKGRCDIERLRNTPPNLSSSRKVDGNQVQPRFIPFSASFSLGAGQNAQSFGVAGGPEGIALSQSSSHGNSDYSASQSSSLAAGLNGISASDSNAVAGTHPLYGPTAQANGNSFSLGQASSAAHGNVVNGQATTSAQSSVGSTHSQASSGAQGQNFVQHPGRPAWTNAQPSYASGNPGNYYYNTNQRPTLSISVNDNLNRYGSRPSGGWYEVPNTNDWEQPDLCRYRDSWYKDSRCRGPRVTVSKPGYNPGYQRPYYPHYRDPRDSAGVAQASAGSSAQSGPGGLAIGQSSSQSGSSNQQAPNSLTLNHVETSGHAQAQAHGSSGTVQQHQQQKGPGSVQANLGSSSISASSGPGGSAQGSSISSSNGNGSTSKVTGTSHGAASAQGSANAGSVSFPGPTSHSLVHSIIPQEYVRSAKKLKNKKKDEKGPIEEILTGLTDAVYDIFDY